MLTIMIPTKNRSDHLMRLLNYYAEIHCPFPICIGDSSEEWHLQKTKKAISLLQGKLQITYREYPQLNDSQCIRELTGLVQTPYAVFLADDDFLIPRGLEECVRFLKKNPDYSAAHGLAVIYNLTARNGGNQIRDAGKYRQPQMEQETAAKRLLAHMSHYSVTLFSVHRREDWQNMYAAIGLLKDKSFTEILPGCLSAIQGKIKELNCFYLVRQNHEKRYFLPDYYDWITHPDWFSSYGVFRDCVAKELAQKDNIRLDQAQRIVKQAFWSYLARGMNREFKATYDHGADGIKEKAKGVLKRTPLLKDHLLPTIRKVQSSLFLSGNMSLSALLNARSPYHADFMPIYNLVKKNERGVIV